MQLVYFSSSEPAPKNAQNRFMHSQKHQGIPLITPLSLRRGVGGEAVRGCVSGCSFPIPSSQVQRGISLIILPLPSERAGERLLFPHSVLSNTPGNLANCSPSPFGEGRGEAPFSSLRPLKYNGVSRFLPPSPFGEGWGEAL